MEYRDSTGEIVAEEVVQRIELRERRDGRPRGFVAYYHFIGWTQLSLGLHWDWDQPNIEIHLPFGFVRLGWSRAWKFRALLSTRTFYLCGRNVNN